MALIEGQVVTFTYEGKPFSGLLIYVKPKYETHCDYYDGRETSREFLYHRYIMLTTDESGFSWYDFKSTDKEYKIIGTSEPDILMKVSVEGGEREVRCTSLGELHTISKAYDLAGIKYRVYSRIT